jgi:hypothetical protein
MSESEKRRRIVADLRPTDWDVEPAIVTEEIRNLLTSIIDHGTNIDSGCGNGCGDLWFTVGGVEFFMTVSRSKKGGQ